MFSLGAPDEGRLCQLKSKEVSNPILSKMDRHIVVLPANPIWEVIKTLLVWSFGLTIYNDNSLPINGGKKASSVDKLKNTRTAIWHGL